MIELVIGVGNTPRKAQQRWQLRRVANLKLLHDLQVKQLDEAINSPVSIRGLVLITSGMTQIGSMGVINSLRTNDLKWEKYVTMYK